MNPKQINEELKKYPYDIRKERPFVMRGVHGLKYNLESNLRHTRIMALKEYYDRGCTIDFVKHGCYERYEVEDENPFIERSTLQLNKLLKALKSSPYTYFHIYEYDRMLEVELELINRN